MNLVNIFEDAGDVAVFEIDNERAYEQVMDKFGHIIEWSGDYMVAPRNVFTQIEQVAFDAGGAANEVTDDMFEATGLTFMGSPCTKDCSGHKAGYEWSEKRGGQAANSRSQSFNNGAAISANKNKPKVQSKAQQPKDAADRLRDKQAELVGPDNAKTLGLAESTDMCKVCGQTPCNCTGITEGKFNELSVMLADYHNSNVTDVKFYGMYGKTRQQVAKEYANYLEEAISRRGFLKGAGAAAAAGAAGKASAIAGAFPTPSQSAAMYKAAADSNAAQARADAAAKAKADAARLRQGTSDVERLNKVNYHGKNAPKPTSAEWDGDSDFLYLDGTQYAKAMRMPISGDVPSDLTLVSTREGRQVYLWTRRSLKGVQGHYFYPAEKPNTIDEDVSIAKPGQLVSIIQAPRILDLLPGETFEVRTSDPEGVTLKHGIGTKFDNVKFPHGTYKILNAQGIKEGSREQVDPNTVWEVCFDYGPHQSDKVKVRASSQEEAEQKGMRAAKKLGHRFPQLNWAMPVEQGLEEGVVYNTLNIDNQNLIDQKAKSKPDGLYTFRGIMFRVRNGRVTHYAAEGTILVSYGNFNSAVGSYSTRDEAKAKLKSIKEGVEEGFDKEEFRRHMEQLRAREELRKTDPVSAKALDLRGQLPQATKKKPEDDSMSINDPRHPGYAYTQAGQHTVDEGLGDEFGQKELKHTIARARAKFPRAASDTEALIMYVQDQEQQDVRKLDQVNDREDKEIDRLDKEENSIEQRLQNVERKLAGVMESRLYYSVVGTVDSKLRSEFGLRKDKNGWYLKESATPKIKFQAYKAFGSPKLKEYDLSAVRGSTGVISGAENPVSPIGSVPRGQQKTRR